MCVQRSFVLHQKNIYLFKFFTINDDNAGISWHNSLLHTQMHYFFTEIIWQYSMCIFESLYRIVWSEQYGIMCFNAISFWGVVRNFVIPSIFKRKTHISPKYVYKCIYILISIKSFPLYFYIFNSLSLLRSFIYENFLEDVLHPKKRYIDIIQNKKNNNLLYSIVLFKV